MSGVDKHAAKQGWTWKGTSWLLPHDEIAKQQLDAARGAVFRTMQKNARAKAVSDDELRKLDLEVTSRAAEYDLREDVVRDPI